MASFPPLETLWRRRNLVLAVAVMVVMVAYSLAGLQANQYEASALFRVPHDYPRFAEKFMGNDLLAFLKTIDAEMDLEDDSNFNSQIPADSSVLERIRPELMEFTENLLGRTNRSAEESVFDQLQNSVHIFEHPEWQAIEIKVLSRSPLLAAKIANRLGEMYQSTLGESYKYKFLREDQADSLKQEMSQQCRDKFLSFSDLKKFDECLKKAHISSTSGENWVLTRKAEESWKAIRPSLSPVLIVGFLVGVVMGIFSAFLADYSYNRMQRR